MRLFTFFYSLSSSPLPPPVYFYSVSFRTLYNNSYYYLLTIYAVSIFVTGIGTLTVFAAGKTIIKYVVETPPFCVSASPDVPSKTKLYSRYIVVAVILARFSVSTISDPPKVTPQGRYYVL